jgi:hypothetical protein
MLQEVGQFHGGDLEIPHFVIESLIMAAQAFSAENHGNLINRWFFKELNLREHIGWNICRYCPPEFIMNAVA